MGTTANNSWPYPESSDYVADGATAIENLADAIDSGVGDTTTLPRLLGFVATASDFTASTGGVNIGSVTGITLTSTRNIFIMCHIPLIQNRSTTNYISMFVNDDVPGVGSATYLASYTNSTNNGFDRLQGYRMSVLGAGTYDFYFNVFANTGTAVCNGAGAGGRYHGMYVYDMGDN